MEARFSNGWYDKARKVESPNQDDFPTDTKLALVIIHGISLPAGEFENGEIERLFTNVSTMEDVASLRVSAHFLLSRSGDLTQFVSCGKRAWHAGESLWRNQKNCNDFSLGIELEGTDTLAYAQPQYESLIALLGDLFSNYPTLGAVVGHCHVAPNRKKDPGEAFDWARLFNSIGTHYDGRSW